MHSLDTVITQWICYISTQMSTALKDYIQKCLLWSNAYPTL